VVPAGAQQAWSVRRYRPEDAQQLQGLYERVTQPYRPEDAAEVSAMHERARSAQSARDRWSPAPADERHVDESAYLAFWVASVPASVQRSIGCVGLRRVGDTETADADTAERSCVASARGSAHLGEVRRLRVDPAWRRRGVAIALMRELMTFSSQPEHAFPALVLNTTSAQLPALALYGKLGFAEVGRCFLGPYELVWMHCDL
jgi:ribosomal protein S18 acetylase RimI-like enzyme